MRGLKPMIPKSLFYYFGSIFLSAIQVNGKDSETDPISAPHSAVLKRFRKQLGAPNFGIQFRGIWLQMLQSFEVLRPVVSEWETSHSPTNHAAVWRTLGARKMTYWRSRVLKRKALTQNLCCRPLGLIHSKTLLRLLCWERSNVSARS